MALIVETGSGVAGANSYASLADALAYHADHGNDAWSAVGVTDPLRTAALIRATMAIEGMYSGRWPGSRILIDQGLSWPRYGAWDIDAMPLLGLPSGVVAATCEAALIELGEPGALSKKFEGGLKTLGIGSISKEWTSSPGAGIMQYPAIRQPLARIIKSSATIALSRG